MYFTLFFRCRVIKTVIVAIATIGSISAAIYFAATTDWTGNSTNPNQSILQELTTTSK